MLNSCQDNLPTENNLSSMMDSLHFS